MSHLDSVLTRAGQIGVSQKRSHKVKTEGGENPQPCPNLTETEANQANKEGRDGEDKCEEQKSHTV